MAHLVADATGDWSAAATWKVCDATGATLLDAQATFQMLPTTFGTSAAFTPGAITIQGLCVKVGQNATPAGVTMTVRLAAAGVAVAGTTVTIDASDLPIHVAAAAAAVDGCSIGWVYFRFAANVTLLAATAYTLQASTSVFNRVSLFRDATVSNWSRLLVTTTTGAPAAGDVLTVVGGRTGAGALAAVVVTMNETLATNYGNANLITASIGIGAGGALLYPATGAATYQLRLSGSLQVWIGGEFRMGRASAPIPRAVKAILEFAGAVDGDYGFVCYGTFSLYGESRSAVKSAVLTRLSADVAALGTTLNVQHDTGWLAGDRIVIGTTTRLNTEIELRVLTAAASATSMATTVGLTHAHSGTAGSQAEVCLIERNVHIRAVTPAATYYWIEHSPADDPEIGWTLWENHGGSTGNQFEFGATGVLVRSRLFQSCAWYGYERAMTTASPNAATTRFRFVDCIGYGLTTVIQLIDVGRILTEVQGGAFLNNSLNGGGGFTFGNQPFTADAALFCGGGVNNGLSGASVPEVKVFLTDCEFHGAPANARALMIDAPSLGVYVMRRCRVWRNAASGFGNASIQNSSSNGSWTDALFEDCDFIGNACAFGAPTSGAGGRGLYRFVNCDFEAELGFTAVSAIVLSTTIGLMFEFHRCRFSQVGPAFTGFDIVSNGAPFPLVGGAGFGFYNTLFGPGVQSTIQPLAIGGTSTYRGTARYSVMRDDGVAFAHETHFGTGTIAYQAAVFKTAAPCEEMIPYEATTYWRLRSADVFKPVLAGQSVTFTVWLRKSLTYNGTQPRLVVAADGNAGWNDTVATMAGAVDVWEQVTVTVGPAGDDSVAVARIECDGTVGSVYVDDWAATVA